MFAFLPNLGFPELMVILVIGVLLFGRKLPDIGRSLGKTVVEFKKGFSGMEEELASGGANTAKVTSVEPEPVRPPQRVTPSATAPKFDDAPTVGSNLPPTV